MQNCKMTPRRKMEAEVVRMTIDLFNGDDDACGSVSENEKPMQSAEVFLGSTIFLGYWFFHYL